MSDGFIVEYNSNTKIGFAKISSIENSYYVFSFVFFNLNDVSTKGPLELSIGDIVSIGQYIPPPPSIFERSTQPNTLVTKINLFTVRTAKFYGFSSRHIPNLLIARDENSILDIIQEKFDLNHLPNFSILSAIDPIKKRNMIKAYLYEDNYNGDYLLRCIVDEYVNLIDFEKLVNEKLNVTYKYEIKSQRYGGRDYIMYSYAIYYETKFVEKPDFYIGSIYSQHKYSFTIKEDSSDDVYVDFNPIVIEYMNEHKTEMESFCNSKTIEIKSDLIKSYSRLDHSRLLYSYFRTEIIKQLFDIRKSTERTDEYWQYSETINFFKKYKLTEDITNRYEFQNWLNMIRNISKNEKNYSLILEKDIYYGCK